MTPFIDIVRFLKQEKGANVFFTTMIDLYAIAPELPGLAQAEPLRPNPIERVEFLETSFAADIDDRRFIPYIQLHEYEAYLFSNPIFYKLFPQKMSNLKLAEYQCLTNLNLYDSPECNRLATQAARGRHLQIISNNLDKAVAVCLCEDDYPGWLSVPDLQFLQPTETRYQPQLISVAEIQQHIPTIIAFTQTAKAEDNYYLWGGTVAPNYDCSGLMQAAFKSVGVWLPRDAYQQEAFTQPIDMTELQLGDLIFFGTPQKATHVGLYLGNNCYIHSSGKEQGRNGIGIDQLSEQGDKVSQAYYQQLRGAGRVVKSYEPKPL